MQLTINKADTVASSKPNRPSSGAYRGRIINIEEIAGNEQYQQSNHIGVDWDLEGFGKYRDRFHINDRDADKAAKHQSRLKDLSIKTGIMPQGSSVESDHLLGKKAIVKFTSFIPKGKEHPITFIKGYETLQEPGGPTPQQGGPQNNVRDIPLNDGIPF